MRRLLDIAYKLSEYSGKGRLKLSSGKPVLPGRKQIFRVEEDGRDVRDTIARAGEALSGRPLLVTVMRNGKHLPRGWSIPRPYANMLKRKSPCCPRR